jgi:drug/metabolite transporter (DMT)-like permease
MDAVLLALTSAALFGAMTVLLRPALARGGDPFLGAFLTVLPAFGVALVAAVAAGEWQFGGLWPFFLAGLLGPGVSQVLFTLAVRDAGASRTSATVGTAPLFAVAFAVVLLGEPLVAGIVAGAALVVGGGVLLAGERDRPEHVKAIGFAFALGACLVFAARDTLVRWLATDSTVTAELAVATTLGAGALTLLATLLVRRARGRQVTSCNLGSPGPSIAQSRRGRRWIARAHGRSALKQVAAFAPAGLAFGLSYVCLFEAYYRGRLSVVSPLVATESLWGVALSALFLRHERVSGRLAAGAALVVAGGVLIGLTR